MTSRSLAQNSGLVGHLPSSALKSPFHRVASGDRLVSDVQEIENGEAIAIRLEAIAIGLESGLLFEHHMHRDTRRAETWLCGS